MSSSVGNDFDFIDESDRGVFIVAAAYLESELDSIIDREFDKRSIPNGLRKNLFCMSGPLSSFYSKITVCYAFGLISKESYRDLSIIRRIRNQVAHSYGDIDLNEEAIDARLNELRCVQRVKKNFGKNDGTEPLSDNKNDFNKDSCGMLANFEESGLSKKQAEEYFARLSGYVAYRKAVFTLAVQDMALKLRVDVLERENMADKEDVLREIGEEYRSKF